MRARTGHRAVLAAATSYAWVDNEMRRGLRSLQHFVGGVLGAGLTDDELVALSARLYDVSDGGRFERTDLFTWEPPWFAASLPSAPARVLVAAAGSGREAVHLERMGYAVDAFEPSAARGSLCARRVRGAVAIASYHDWAGAVLDGADTPARELAARRYDAVLLGWGSLSHVLAAAEQQRVIAAAAAATPSGPVLASFWLGAGAAASGRAWRVGAAVGAALARARRVQPARRDAEFTPWAGFAHSFSRAEIEQLALAIGRSVTWHDTEGATPHATLLP